MFGAELTYIHYAGPSGSRRSSKTMEMKSGSGSSSGTSTPVTNSTPSSPRASDVHGKRKEFTTMWPRALIEGHTKL